MCVAVRDQKYLRIRETISVVSETDVLRRARTIPLKLQAVHRISLTYLLTHSPPHVLHLTPHHNSLRFSRLKGMTRDDVPVQRFLT